MQVGYLEGFSYRIAWMKDLLCMGYIFTSCLTALSVELSQIEVWLEHQLLLVHFEVRHFSSTRSKAANTCIMWIPWRSGSRGSGVNETRWEWIVAEVARRLIKFIPVYGVDATFIYHKLILRWCIVGLTVLLWGGIVGSLLILNYLRRMEVAYDLEELLVGNLAALEVLLK
jgi:hypothetical protein